MASELYKRVKRMIDEGLELTPPIYYIDEELCTPGNVFMIEETDYTHECIVAHPDDLERLKREVPGRWVHIRNAPIKIPNLASARYMALLRREIAYAFRIPKDWLND